VRGAYLKCAISLLSLIIAIQESINVLKTQLGYPFKNALFVLSHRKQARAGVPRRLHRSVATISRTDLYQTEPEPSRRIRKILISNHVPIFCNQTIMRYSNKPHLRPGFLVQMADYADQREISNNQVPKRFSCDEPRSVPPMDSAQIKQLRGKRYLMRIHAIVSPTSVPSRCHLGSEQTSGE